MRFVVNTNILFSFFNEKSTAREYATFLSVELYAPVFALEEITEHKGDIVKRFHLSDFQFTLIMKFLHTIVTFVPIKDYASFLPKASKISPDPDDIDFFALSMKLQCPLWSNDAALKKQSYLKIISTKEFIKKQEE